MFGERNKQRKVGFSRETACLGTNAKWHILFHFWCCFKIPLSFIFLNQVVLGHLFLVSMCKFLMVLGDLILLWVIST